MKTRHTNAKKKLNMLIVDDEADILRSLKGLFRRKFRITTATSGEEALEIIREKGVRFHLVLSDQRMAGMQGAELLKEIHGLYGETASILITGYSDMPGLVQAVNEGHIYGFLAKPWEPEELEAMVEKAANRLLRVFPEQDEDAEDTGHEPAEKNIHHLLNPAQDLLRIIESVGAAADWDIYLDSIKSACLDLVKSVDIETGKPAEMIAESLDVSARISDAATHMMPYAKARDVRLNNTVREPFTAMANGKLITTVMISILKYAVTYTEPAGTVTVSAMSDDDALCIRVGGMDTAISAPHLTTLFDSGQSGSMPGTGERRGAGLSLAVCRQIMRRFGASIDVEYAPGKGACLSLTLPRWKKQHGPCS